MSLVQVTRETRLILKFGGAAIAALFLMFLLFKGGSFIQQAFFPTPPPPPEEKFGKLPAISFPAQAGSFPEFRINTISGALPVFPPTIRVYKFLQLDTNITALQTAKGRAAILGYTQNQQSVTASQYRWTKNLQNNALLYDIVSLNFSVASDYLLNSAPGGNITDKEAVKNAISDFINTLGGNKTDIDLENGVFNYYISADGRLTDVTDPNSASFVRVYLPQKKVDQMNIYYAAPNPSSLYFTLAGPNTSDVVDASYNHFTPDLNTYSTYPIKTADKAFQDLQNGKGFIVSPTAQSTVDITDVALGYYIGNEQNQAYLIPIVIFSGKNNFRAYVSAIPE